MFIIQMLYHAPLVRPKTLTMNAEL